VSVVFTLIRTCPVDISCAIFSLFMFVFFCNAPRPSEIYSLSLHDALPISVEVVGATLWQCVFAAAKSSSVERIYATIGRFFFRRSEEHTSELQSRFDLVCRLLLEKKKNKSRIK